MGQFKLQPDQVVFRPTKFDKPPLVDWKEDLKKPSVYLPCFMLCILLLLLSFLFLFAELLLQSVRRRAAREEVRRALRSSDKAEDKGEDGKGEDDETLEELSKGELDIMLGRKPPEPPPAPPEEDEAMKKFEPFTYITEENFKRLANLFLVRQDEPWLVAVVLSYLKPDIGRATLTALPIEMQAKIAIEALKIRQVTREQLMAIDADIKESVDFVVGGMERLTQLLDEADTLTRANILQYLKNEKPEVYQRVRKFILTFEDAVTFPDRDMQTIVRELKTEAMAKALQGAAPDVVNKFLSNMSTGAASLLKESIEYAQGLTPSQIEEERSKIMDVIKVLEKEGKINVRQSKAAATRFPASTRRSRAEAGRKIRAAHLGRGAGRGAGLLQRDQRRSRRRATRREPRPPRRAPAARPGGRASGPAIRRGRRALPRRRSVPAGRPIFGIRPFARRVPRQARQYLGNCYVQLGRGNDAIAQFEAVLAVNPDEGLRQWVDGMKAQAI